MGKPTRATRDYRHKPGTLRLRGCHPLWPNIPGAFGFRAEARPGIHTPHLPGVLHRGFGLPSSAFTRRYLRNHDCFLFLHVLKCFTSVGSRSRPPSAGARGGISPAHEVVFGNPGINACVQLPRAYRSLPRPSSVPSKPRYPPRGVGVSGRSQERVQYEPGPIVPFMTRTLGRLRVAG